MDPAVACRYRLLMQFPEVFARMICSFPLPSLPADCVQPTYSSTVPSLEALRIPETITLRCQF